VRLQKIRVEFGRLQQRRQALVERRAVQDLVEGPVARQERGAQLLLGRKVDLVFNA
jgi:hypothetical protein